MTRHFITFLFIVCFCLQLSAQNKERSWGEVNFAIEQNFMLTKWFGNSETNKMTPKMNIPYFMFGIDVRVINGFGVFSHMGFGIRKRQKGFADDHNSFDHINLVEYNMEDISKMNKNSNIDGKINLGVFYRFHKKDWQFIPQMGVGFSYFYHSQLSYTLKKIGANDKYNVNYGINRYRDDGIMNFALFKLKAQRKLSNSFSLNFTTEYDLYIQKPKYVAEYINYYNDAIVETKNIKGKRMHGLILGVGVSFR